MNLGCPCFIFSLLEYKLFKLYRVTYVSHKDDQFIYSINDYTMFSDADDTFLDSVFIDSDCLFGVNDSE